MTVTDMGYILDTVRDLPLMDMGRVIRDARSLITDDMSAFEICNQVRLCSTNQGSLLQSLLRNVHELMQDFHETHSQNIDVTQYFYVDINDVQAHPMQVLLNFYNSILENNGRLLSVKYIGSSGVDAGGLTRDFITRLFKFVCSVDNLPMKSEDQGILPKIDGEVSSISKKDQIQHLKAMGAIFGAALFNRAFTTGAYFHPVIFEMIKALSLKEIESIPEDLADSRNLTLQTLQKLLKPLLMAVYPSQFPDASALDEAFAQDVTLDSLGSTVGEFLEGYPEVTNIALAVAVIAKAMKKQLGEEFESKIPATYQELSKLIQGTEVSREAVLEALEGLDTEQLKRWVNQATPEQLKQLVFSITGSTTLRFESKLKVNMINSDETAFYFHTCFSSVDIKKGLSEEEFKLQLDASIQGDGFNRA